MTAAPPNKKPEIRDLPRCLSGRVSCCCNQRQETNAVAHRQSKRAERALVDDLYPTVFEKAAALGYSLIQGHSFTHGNKRIGHAAMEAFLVLNGLEISGAAVLLTMLAEGVATQTEFAPSLSRPR